MVITDKLLFLHLHKSGGTFVNQLLLRCVPSARHIGYHLPYGQTPAVYRRLPVVGTVRSPWAYYVSWYHFQANQPVPNILFQICSDRGKLGFVGTVTNLVNLADDEPRLERLREGLPAHFLNHGLNLTKACVGQLREAGLGFYSFLHRRLYAGASDPMIIQSENLRDGLRSALSQLGHLPNHCVDRFLKEVPPLNVSRHEAPPFYFDDELAALVGKRDSEVIDRYGYALR